MRWGCSTGWLACRRRSGLCVACLLQFGHTPLGGAQRTPRSLRHLSHRLCARGILNGAPHLLPHLHPGLSCLHDLLCSTAQAATTLLPHASFLHG